MFRFSVISAAQPAYMATQAFFARTSEAWVALVPLIAYSALHVIGSVSLDDIEPRRCIRLMAVIGGRTRG